MRQFFWEHPLADAVAYACLSFMVVAMIPIAVAAWGIWRERDINDEDE